MSEDRLAHALQRAEQVKARAAETRERLEKRKAEMAAKRAEREAARLQRKQERENRKAEREAKRAARKKGGVLRVSGNVVIRGNVRINGQTVKAVAAAPPSDAISPPPSFSSTPSQEHRADPPGQQGGAATGKSRNAPASGNADGASQSSSNAYGAVDEGASASNAYGAVDHEGSNAYSAVGEDEGASNAYGVMDDAAAPEDSAQQAPSGAPGAPGGAVGGPKTTSSVSTGNTALVKNVTGSAAPDTDDDVPAYGVFYGAVEDEGESDTATEDRKQESDGAVHAVQACVTDAGAYGSLDLGDSEGYGSGYAGDFQALVPDSGRSDGTGSEDAKHTGDASLDAGQSAGAADSESGLAEGPEGQEGNAYGVLLDEENAGDKAQPADTSGNKSDDKSTDKPTDKSTDFQTDTPSAQSDEASANVYGALDDQSINDERSSTRSGVDGGRCVGEGKSGVSTPSQPPQKPVELQPSSQAPTQRPPTAQGRTQPSRTPQFSGGSQGPNAPPSSQPSPAPTVIGGPARFVPIEKGSQKWVPDTARSQCRLCKTQFAWLTRRHHCRACGDVFCDKCSHRRFRLHARDYRVCVACYRRRFGNSKNTIGVIKQPASANKPSMVSRLRTALAPAKGPEGGSGRQPQAGLGSAGVKGAGGAGKRVGVGGGGGGAGGAKGGKGGDGGKSQSVGSNPAVASGNVGGGTGLTGPSSTATRQKPNQTASPPSKPTPPPPDRDWNQEYQKLLDRLHAAGGEQESPGGPGQSSAAVECDRLLRQLIAEFVAVTRRAAAILVAERTLPAGAPRQIAPLDAGGVAGGQKFVYGGVFLKFALETGRDPKLSPMIPFSQGLYGGDEFAQKVVSHEIKGLVQLAGVPSTDADHRLRGALMCVCDLSGYRVTGMSKLPLSKGSLVYGSADAGRVVHKSDSVCTQLMESAGRALNLAKHAVGPRGRETELALCCDIEGHLGSDGRRYVLDTARVFPPETPHRAFPACLLPCDPFHPMQMLVEQKLARAVRRRLPDARSMGTVYAPFYGLYLFGEVSLDPKAWGSLSSVNLRVQSMLQDHGVWGSEQTVTSGSDGGRVVLLHPLREGEAPRVLDASAVRFVGDVLVVGKTNKAPHLVNMLRPEMCKKAQHSLSSDAFTGFGRHRAKTHNSRVRQATAQLREQVIPEFAKQLQNYSEFVGVGGGAEGLVARMHAHGINARYLGALLPLISATHRVYKVVVTEMVARACKRVLQRRMHLAVQTARQPHQVNARVVAACVGFLNLLFGGSLWSRRFWQFDVKLLVHLKYGGYSPLFGMYSPLKQPSADWRPFVQGPQLLRSLVESVGLEFSNSTFLTVDFPLNFLDRYLHMWRPFNVQMLRAPQPVTQLGVPSTADGLLDAVTSRLGLDLGVLSWHQGGSRVPESKQSRQSTDPMPSTDWTQLASFAQQHFGASSPQLGAASLCTAWGLCLEGRDFQAVLPYLQRGCFVLLSQSGSSHLSVDEMVGVCYFAGVVLERAGRYGRALDFYFRAKQWLEAFYGVGMRTWVTDHRDVYCRNKRQQAASRGDPKDPFFRYLYATERNTRSAQAIKMEGEAEYQTKMDELKESNAAGQAEVKQAMEEYRKAMKSADTRAHAPALLAGADRMRKRNAARSKRMRAEATEARNFHNQVANNMRLHTRENASTLHPMALVVVERLVVCLMAVSRHTTGLLKEYVAGFRAGAQPRGSLGLSTLLKVSVSGSSMQSLAHRAATRFSAYFNLTPFPHDQDICRRAFHGLEVPLSLTVRGGNSDKVKQRMHRAWAAHRTRSARSSLNRHKTKVAREGEVEAQWLRLLSRLDMAPVDLLRRVFRASANVSAAPLPRDTSPVVPVPKGLWAAAVNYKYEGGDGSSTGPVMLYGLKR